jgi:3-oxoacyl-[acyl-carrier-protein] synthase II
MRRIAITGLGSLNGLGAGIESFEEGLRFGRCGIGEITAFPADGYRSSIAAEVKDVPRPPELPARLLRRASRSSLLALVSAAEAWRMSRPSAAGGSLGVVIGTTTGGMTFGEERYRRVRASAAGESVHRGAAAQSQWLETPVSAPADVVAHAFDARGPRLTVSTACSSGANALGIAADMIRAERADVVLCGGTDSLCRMTYSGFNSLQALDRVPCRPFDRERAGLTLGEGAAMLVLEDWERARARGAEILAELVSYGVSADAHHLTQPRPDGEGAVLAMRRALEGGGVSTEEIDYVNAHGTGTPQNDVVETRALRQVFANRAERVPVSSTKSMIGHLLGAAGAAEAVACVLALRGAFVPPTIHLEHPDPECDLDYVPHRSRSQPLRTVLSSSYGFGGNNTSLILRAA